MPNSETGGMAAVGPGTENQRPTVKRVMAGRHTRVVYTPFTHTQGAYSGSTHHYTPREAYPGGKPQYIPKEAYPVVNLSIYTLWYTRVVNTSLYTLWYTREVHIHRCTP